ncbi:hypothetical protein [Ensifer canadensis]
MMDTARGNRAVGEGIVLPAEFDDGVVWAAWLYYVDQLTPSEIAKMLGVLQGNDRQLPAGSARAWPDRQDIRLNTEVGSRTGIARRLKDKFGLEGALVIPALDDGDLVQRLGEAGARLLADIVRQATRSASPGAGRCWPWPTASRFPSR